MSKTDKLMAINVGVMTGRVLMGAGCGLFVRTVTKQLVQGCGFLGKAGIWTTALCAAWALGHAVDCYWDKTWKILAEMAGVSDLNDIANDVLEDILEEMET